MTKGERAFLASVGILPGMSTQEIKAVLDREAKVHRGGNRVFDGEDVDFDFKPGALVLNNVRRTASQIRTALHWYTAPEGPDNKKGETEMNELARTNESAMATIRGYETRIADARRQVVTGYLDIGQVLIEAKESGLIAHGEWEDWMTQQTGMSVRNCQRCMRAAREVGEDSRLRNLDLTKVTMLLASPLDGETREALAGEAAEMSSRELAERIAAARKEGYDAGMAEGKAAAPADSDILQQYAGEIRRLKGLLEKAESRNADIGNRAVRDRIAADREIAQYRSQIDQLRGEMAKAAGLDAEARKAQQHSRELAAQIERLEEDLERASRERKEAQEEALRLRARQAAEPAPEPAGMTPDAVSAVVHTFLAQMAQVPLMAGDVAAQGDRAWELVRESLAALRNWVNRAEAALNSTLPAGGDVL